MRLFVAVWPSEEASAALAALPRPPLPGVRWTTPDQWHVTLAFLGEVPDVAAGQVAAALDVAAGRARPPEAMLGPATARLGRSILCVPVEGLEEVGAAVRSTLVGRGLDPGDATRPFRAHCTVARARRGRVVPPALAGVPVQARWSVGAVCLVRSTLDPAAARYDTLWSATVPS